MELLNKILWSVATPFILYLSIYFTIKLNFQQFKIKTIIKSLLLKNNKSGLNSKETLMISLAGKIGVGSIAGISLAIYVGGIGSIFWIIIMNTISYVLAYSETVLGNIYKEKDGNFYKGGPSYYIKKGLNKPYLGNIYAFLIIVSYIIGFVSIQSNTIVSSIKFNPYFIGIILVIIVFLVIQKGLKTIAQISTKMVPIMMITYLLLGIFVIIKNIELIPINIKYIIVDALNLKPFFSGFLSTFFIGIQRGIFASEAGLGTGSIASSVSSNDNSYVQGNIQILGVYITNIIILITSFIILTSNYENLDLIDLNGIEIAQNAFYYHFGNLGQIILSFSIFLFAFSTILTGYYYGESSFKYLNNNTNLTFLKILTLIMVYLGCITSSSVIWKMIDIFVAILSLINIYAIYNLRKDIIKETTIGLIRTKKNCKMK